MGSVRLFVYGTLKRGGRNHGLLRGQTFLCQAITQPQYRLYDTGAYPCLVREPARGLRICGELWEVSEAAMPALDELEGVPDLFGREAIDLIGVAGPVQAYVYRRGVDQWTDCGDTWPGDRGNTGPASGVDAGP